LAEVGLSKAQIGLLLSLTLMGDVAVSLWMAVNADSFGRKRTLVLSSLLIVFAGSVFIVTNNFTLLLLAAIVGVISPSGNEVGPFLSIEQAALSQIMPDNIRTRIFAWYHLCGFFATAFGSLCAGLMIRFASNAGATSTESYQIIIYLYAGLGVIIGILLTQLSIRIEAPIKKSLNASQKYWGLQDSRSKVFKLAALFALDAFGGGFHLQSILAYWFYVRFQIDSVMLGGIFFGMNILAGFSGLLAARIASRIGLINTMVFTHFPSNVLIILVPLMPNLPWAITILLLRSVISKMDVPTRQSYTMAVVHPEERSAAAGIVNTARTLGASIAPVFALPLLASANFLSYPFFLAGGIKIIYDVLLYAWFKSVKPKEEVARK
jgi:MFS family permease